MADVRNFVLFTGLLVVLSVIFYRQCREDNPRTNTFDDAQMRVMGQLASKIASSRNRRTAKPQSKVEEGTTASNADNSQPDQDSEPVDVSNTDWELSAEEASTARSLAKFKEAQRKMLHDQRRTDHILYGDAPHMEELAAAASPLNGRCACYSFTASETSESWCPDTDGIGGTSVLSSFHVCLLNHVCVEAGGDKGATLLVYTETEDDVEAHVPSPPGFESIEFVKGKPKLDYNGTAVVVAGAEAAGDLSLVRHVGSMFWGRNELKSSTCLEHDLSCIKGVGTLLVASEAAPRPWTLRALSFASQNGGVARLLTTSKENRETVCFHKIVLPGAFPSVWPVHPPAATELQTSLETNIRDALLGKNAPPPVRQNERNGKKLSERSIILAKPSAIDTQISEFEALEKIVSEEADRVGVPLYVLDASAGLTQNGKTVSGELEWHFQHAGLFISPSGPSLYHAALLRRGSGVVELNPLFLVDESFADMAKAFGLHFVSWSCSRTNCFGGDVDAIASEYKIQYDKGTSVFRSAAGGSFAWPQSYLSLGSCPECHEIAAAQLASPAAKLVIRKGGILIADARDEIRRAVQEAITVAKLS